MMSFFFSFLFFAGYGNGKAYSAGVQPDYASKYHCIKFGSDSLFNSV